MKFFLFSLFALIILVSCKRKERFSVVPLKTSRTTLNCFQGQDVRSLTDNSLSPIVCKNKILILNFFNYLSLDQMFRFSSCNKEHNKFYKNLYVLTQNGLENLSLTQSKKIKFTIDFFYSPRNYSEKYIESFFNLLEEYKFSHEKNTSGRRNFNTDYPVNKIAFSSKVNPIKSYGTLNFLSLLDHPPKNFTLNTSVRKDIAQLDHVNYLPSFTHEGIHYFLISSDRGKRYFLYFELNNIWYKSEVNYSCSDLYHRFTLEQEL